MSNSPSSDAPSDSARLIVGHQRQIYERLLAIGRACFSVQRHTLPTRLKTNMLLIGPTGVGKTFLAEAVARELDVPFLPLAVSNWIILSGTDRGAQTTWVSVADFLYKSRTAAGAVIFLDEIDKQRHTPSSWDQQTQVESFLLLDGRVPSFLKDAAGDVMGEGIRSVVRDMLANRTFIIAGGAFQHLWEHRVRQNIGFGKPNNDSPPPTPNELARTLPREIVNRFSGEILVLPPLRESDYRSILETIAGCIPSYLRDTFLRIGHEKIPAALEMAQGFRFVEDVVLQTLLAERAIARMPHPAQLEFPSDKREAKQLKANLSAP